MTALDPVRPPASVVVWPAATPTTSSTVVVTTALPVIGDATVPGVEVPGVDTDTVDVAPEAGAVKRPPDVMVPPPVADHVNGGWMASGLPN